MVFANFVKSCKTYLGLVNNVDDILFIFQYQVSTTVVDLIVVFALFVFMLVLLYFLMLPYFR